MDFRWLNRPYLRCSNAAWTMCVEMLVISCILIVPIAIVFASAVPVYAAPTQAQILKAMGASEPPARITQLRKLAAAGDAMSMDHLGGCYRQGYGVRKDYRKAIEWFRRAANKGNAQAMVDLGLMYGNGQGVIKDYSHAMNLFRKAAGLHSPDAMAELGMTYLYGLWGVKTDYGRALKWLRRGAAHSNIYSMFALADVYWNGLGVPANRRTSVKWLLRIASSGPVVTGKKHDHLYLDLKWEGPQSMWVHALTELGRCYKTGRGVKKDSKRAVEWFRKAAGAYGLDAMDELALAYLNGQGAKRAPKKSIQWLRKATSMGDGRAMYIFGLMYEQGDGVNEDKSEAIKWFRKAVKAGNKRAKAHLQALQTAATQRSVKGK